MRSRQAIVGRVPREAPVLFEVRGLPLQTTGDAMPHYQGVRIGNVIHCEGGTVIGGWALDRTGAKIKQFKGDGGGGHFHNFIQAMRSRKVEDLKADILEGHLSSVLCHTGSISHRLGQTHSPDEISEQVKAQPDAVEAFARMKEHLAVHAVDLAQTPAILGPWLTMDPKTERVVGPLAEEANQHLSRAYREPFVIRDPV
jgi:hypothetical protein